MNLLGICCSPRKGGNTEILLQEVLKGAAEAGIQTDLFLVHDKDIKPCDGCRTCRKDGVCHIKDDMQPLYERLLAAQGVVFGAPVYLGSLPGQGKSILDRLSGYYPLGKLSNKVGGAVAVAAAGGHIGVRDMLYSFFARSHMFIADFISAFADDKGEMRRDRFAMACANLLGQKIASMMKLQLHYPDGFNVPITTIVRDRLNIPASPSKGRFLVEAEVKAR